MKIKTDIYRWVIELVLKLELGTISHTSKYNALQRVVIKITDYIFSLFKEYRVEREILRNRKIQQIKVEQENTSKPNKRRISQISILDIEKITNSNLEIEKVTNSKKIELTTNVSEPPQPIQRITPIVEAENPKELLEAVNLTKTSENSPELPPSINEREKSLFTEPAIRQDLYIVPTSPILPSPRNEREESLESQTSSDSEPVVDSPKEEPLESPTSRDSEPVVDSPKEEPLESPTSRDSEPVVDSSKTIGPTKKSWGVYSMLKTASKVIAVAAGVGLTLAAGAWIFKNFCPEKPLLNDRFLIQDNIESLNIKLDASRWFSLNSSIPAHCFSEIPQLGLDFESSTKSLQELAATINQLEQDCFTQDLFKQPTKQNYISIDDSLLSAITCQPGYTISPDIMRQSITHLSMYLDRMLEEHSSQKDRVKLISLQSQLKILQDSELEIQKESRIFFEQLESYQKSLEMSSRADKQEEIFHKINNKKEDLQIKFKEKIKNLFEKLLSEKKSFLFPYNPSGDILHLIAGEKADAWKIRLYNRNSQPSSSTRYEEKELTISELQNPKIFSRLADQHLNFLPPVSLEGLFSEQPSNFFNQIPSPQNPDKINLLFPEIGGSPSDWIHTELGLDGMLSYQLAVVTDYLKHSRSQIETKPKSFNLIKNVLENISRAYLLVGSEGEINEESFTKNTHLIHDLFTDLRLSKIKLKKHLRKQAPLVIDERQGNRNTFKGKLPHKASHPLEKRTPSTTTLEPYSEPSHLIDYYKPTDVGEELQLNLAQLKDVSAQIEQGFLEGLQTYRRWTKGILKSQDITGIVTNHHEASQLLSQLEKIANSLDNITVHSYEIASALAETAAVLPTIISKLDDPILSNASLPLDQLCSALQNPAIFGLHNASSTIDKQAKQVDGLKKEPFFGRAINPTDFIDLEFFMLDDPIQWPYQNLRYQPLNQLPPHMLYKIDLNNKTSTLKCIKDYLLNKNQPSENYENIRSIIKSNGLFSAKSFTENLVKAEKYFSQLSLKNPEALLDTIRSWTKNLNQITPITLEMLNDEQIDQILISLGNIAQTYVAANWFSGVSLAEPDTAISFLEMLTLTDKILSYSPKSEHHYYALPLEIFSGILNNDNPFFRTLDPAIDNIRIANLRKWFLGRFEANQGKKIIFGQFRGFFQPETLELYKSKTAQVPPEIEIGFIQNRLNHPKTKSASLIRHREHMITNFFALKKEGFEAYKQDKSTIAPGWFQSIRDLTYFTYHVLRSGFTPPPSPSSSIIPKHFIREDIKGEHSILSITHSLPGLTYEDLETNGIPDGYRRYHHFKHLEPLIEKPGVVKRNRDVQTQLASEFCMVPYRLDCLESLPDLLSRGVYDENFIMSQDVSQERYGLSSQNYRLQYALRSEPSLQIGKVIDYYTSKPSLLTEFSEQVEFVNLLFDPGLLDIHLQTPEVGPTAEKKLSEFLYNQYLVHSNNSQMQIFFTEIATRLKQYSHYARDAAPGVYTNTTFPEKLEQLCQITNKKLNNTLTSKSDKSSYGAIKAISYLTTDSISETEVSEFLNAVLTYRSATPTPMATSFHIDRQIDRMLARFAPTIKKTISEKINDVTFLKKTFSGLIEKPDLLQLVQISKNQPFIFTDPQGIAEINFLEGTLRQKGQEGVFIPMEARISENYQTVFGSKTYRGTYVAYQTFKFKNKDGVVHIIQKNSKTGNWQLYREFEGQSFQLVSNEWSERDTSSGTKKQYPWLPSKWLLQHHHTWVSNQKENPTIYLTDAHGKASYRVILGEDTEAILGVYQLSPTEKSELQLADINQEAYRWVRNFENPDFAHVWLDSTTKRGAQITFPRLSSSGLSFKQKEGRWLLETDPDYHVVEHQFHPIFPEEQGQFLLLRNSKGSERLLIPKFRLKGWDDSGAMIVDKEGARDQIELCSFEKNSRTGKYEGLTPEANLYLAALHFGHGNYMQAHDLLLTLMNYPNHFSKEMIEELDSIINGILLPKNVHHTPENIAIRTLAAYIRKSNSKEHPLSETSSYTVPSSLQTLYLENIDYIEGLRLPSENEADLFRENIIFNQKGSLVEKLAKMQKCNPLAAKEAIDTTLKKLLFGSQSIQLSEECSELSIEPVFHSGFSTKRLQSLIDFEDNPSLLTKFFFNKTDTLPQPTQNRFKEYEQGVEEYDKTSKKGTYTLGKPNEFTKIRIELEKSLKEINERREKLRWHIMQKANPIPKDPKVANQLLLNLELGNIHPVTLEQLIGAFSSGQIDQYRILNKELTKKDALEVDRLVHEFINIEPELNFQHQLLIRMQLVEQALLSQDTSLNRTKLQLALQDFHSATEAGRHFQDDAPRLMKVMEYQTGSYYRSIQVKSLIDIGLSGLSDIAEKDTSSVHRIKVGAGKTTRIQPSLLRSKIQKGALALGIMPEAQLPTGGKELAYIMSDVYNIATQELEISRSKKTISNLRRKAKKLKKAVTDGIPVVSSEKSLRNQRALLIGQFQAYLQQRNSNPQGAQFHENNVKYLRRISKILAESEPIIDEIDRVFAPRIETNHPIGEALPLDDDAYGVITLNLFELLRDEPSIKQKMNFNFLPTAHHNPKAEPFDSQTFTNDIAPILAKSFLEKIKKDKDIDKELHHLKDFLVKLNDDQVSDVLNYVLPKSTLDSRRGNIADWIPKISDKRTLQQLAMIRGQLNTLMPLTLDYNFGERYGFSNPSQLEPIPCSAAGKCNLHSQFSSPFERFNYLIQANFHEGLREGIVKTVIDNLKASHLKELSERIEESEVDHEIVTNSDKEFQEIFKIKDLHLSSPDLEKQIFVRLSSSPELLRCIIKDYALKQVMIYQKNLKITSQHLGNMFASWKGVSGTPGNYPTYPGVFKPPGDYAVVGRLLRLLNQTQVYTEDLVDPMLVFDLDYVKSQADAFIDAGAWFATMNPADVAKKWGWSADVGRAPVWIDADSNQGVVIQPNPEAKPIPLRNADIPKEKRIALYDQANIVGTDIPHKKNAKGFVTVSKGMTLPELEQATGRMRDLENGQSVDLLVLEKDAIIMRKKLGLPEKIVLKKDDIIRYLIIKESEKQMNDSEVALRHKLQAVVENYFYYRILNNDLPIDNPHLVELIDTIFFKPLNTSPYELFGHQEQEQAKELAFNQEADNIIEKITPFLEKVFKKDEVEKIKYLFQNEMTTIIKRDLPYIRSTILKKTTTDIEQEQELLQEQETEVQQEQEAQQEQQLETLIPYSLPTSIPLSHKVWWNKFRTESIMTTQFWQPRPPKPSPDAQFHTIPQLAQASKQASGFCDLFDERLMSSNNYQQNPLLSSPQKPAQFIVITKDSSGSKLIFTDTWDTSLFKEAWQTENGYQLPSGPLATYRMMKYQSKKSKKQLNHLQDDFYTSVIYPKDQDQPKRSVSSSHEVEIWIGTLSGQHESGKAKVFDLTDPDIRRLWAQAQIFGGRFDFTGDEKKDQLTSEITQWLDQWANSKASKDKDKKAWLREAENFIKKLHSSQEDMIARFASTDVGKIFQKLIIG